MERSSFIFYQSFLDAVERLPKKDRGDALYAICKYGISGEMAENISAVADAIFTMAKPNIDANNQRFANGKNGGRPRKDKTESKPNHNQTKTKVKPNKDVDIDVNVDKDYNEYRDNKLSLSVACATDKERDRFFEIFFFSNFVNPAAEVERFVSNYEASGWIRSNGQLAKNREALAKAWAEEPKNREAKRRFTGEFLSKWEILYGQTKKEGKLDAGVLLRGIYGASFEENGNMLRLAVTPGLARVLKGSWDVYFVRFFDKYYPGKQIKWWAVK